MRRQLMPLSQTSTKTQRILVHGEELTLLSQRAVFWQRNNTLLVADAHFGKASTFRVNNLAIPHGTTQKNLTLLSEMILGHGVEHLIFLGDFIHSPVGMTEPVIQQMLLWREMHAGLSITLVKGNHDRKIGPIARSLRIELQNEPFVLDPFAMKHHPTETKTHYVLCGHTHPSVRLVGKGRQTMRLPCFVFGDRVATLPAFGSFTGCADVEPQETDRIFVVADDSVIEVS